jgi:hypothetical protein
MSAMEGLEVQDSLAQDRDDELLSDASSDGPDPYDDEHNDDGSDRRSDEEDSWDEDDDYYQEETADLARYP